MTIWRKLAVALLALGIALAPALAEARAGGSVRSGGGTSYQSQGSRGLRTYNNDGAQPLQRSITPPSAAAAPTYDNTGSFWGRHPFLSAMAGGFFGAWLGSLLFPGWGWGGMFAGSIFSWILIVLLGVMLFRAFRRHLVPVPAGDFASPYQARTPLGAMPLGLSPPASASLGITEQDYSAFEAILKGVQAAWGSGDLAALRRFVTPEMLSYFSESLSNNTSLGVENHVEQVALLNGDLREAWNEGPLEYATALLRWSALDYTVRSDRRPNDPDYLVEGNPQHPIEAQEMWTFVRSPGGHWLLSAIQQV